MADHEGDSDAVSAETPQEPFTYKGACTDEVTLRFDDGKELYVSENLLRYTSPVFAEMLKEHQDGVIELKERSYADMLMFLRTIHPGLEDTVTESNVFTIVELAETFCVKGIIVLCKECFTGIVRRATEQVLAQGLTGWGGEESKTKAVSSCLAVLVQAERYHYSEIEETAITTIARVSCNVYMENIRSEALTSFFEINFTYCLGYSIDTAAERNKCRQLYTEISAATQVKIISRRLLKLENNTITT